MSTSSLSRTRPHKVLIAQTVVITQKDAASVYAAGKNSFFLRSSGILPINIYKIAEIANAIPAIIAAESAPERL